MNPSMQQRIGSASRRTAFHRSGLSSVRSTHVLTIAAEAGCCPTRPLTCPDRLRAAHFNPSVSHRLTAPNRCSGACNGEDQVKGQSEVT